jgi:VanZ family protein
VRSRDEISTSGPVVVSFLVRRFLKYWLPVLLWMIFICVSSTDLMSAEHTSRFIGPFLRWFSPDITEATVASVQLFVRKCAHLTEYAILASLLFRALRQGRDHFRRAAAIALAISAISAAIDEFHQSFVPSRIGSPYDVAIDVAGALAGLTVYGFMIRRKHSTIQNRNSKIEN